MHRTSRTVLDGRNKGMPKPSIGQSQAVMMNEQTWATWLFTLHLTPNEPKVFDTTVSNKILLSYTKNDEYEADKANQ